MRRTGQGPSHGRSVGHELTRDRVYMQQHDNSGEKNSRRRPSLQDCSLQHDDRNGEGPALTDHLTVNPSRGNTYSVHSHEARSRRAWELVSSHRRAAGLRSRGRAHCFSVVFLALMCRTVDAWLGSFGGLCNSSLGVPNTITGTINCGISVALSSSGSAQPTTLRVGFAVNHAVPSDAAVRVVLPTQRGGFAFNAGGVSTLNPLITAQGTVTNSPLHGTGDATMRIDGSVITVTLGSFGAPTLADSQAGFEFEVTNLHTPYPNAGLPRANATVALLFSNGTVWHNASAELPEFVANAIGPANVSLALTDSGAGVTSDLLVSLSTAGFVPPDGRMLFSFPGGFTLSPGSTVALNQFNVAEEAALYVASLDPDTNVVTLLVAPTLGYSPALLPPLADASFRLTAVRTPPAGTTGTFAIQTLSGSGDVIDTTEGGVPGVEVAVGALRDVRVSLSGDAARQPAEYSFLLSTTGVVPGDGRIVIVFPFGYFLDGVQLVSFNGLSAVGVAGVGYSGLTATVTLGGGNSSRVLDATDGISVTLSGIVNPGAGSTQSYLIQTAHADGSAVDEATVPGLGITTGLFPSRSVTISENRAGAQTVVTVSFVTEGFIPNDARVLVTFPAGLEMNLPATSSVAASVCCSAASGCADCGITIVRITGQEALVKLAGNGSANLDMGTNVTFGIDNVRNVFAGRKDGFDVSLLLSDELSVVMQAKDVDGPLILPGRFTAASVTFGEQVSLPDRYGQATAGRCGAFQFLIKLNGTVPAGANVRVTFPETVQLNDAFCDFDINFPQPISRLTSIRVPPDLRDLGSDAGARTVDLVVNSTSSDAWTLPGELEFYIVNARPMAAGQLDPFKVEVLLSDGQSLVELDDNITLLPVLAAPSVAATATLASLAAGVRTTLDVRVQIAGRLPRAGFVDVHMPASLRLNDGDTTQVLQSTVNGTVGAMFVEASDEQAGVARVRIDPDTSLADGLVNSTARCTGVGTNCVRSPATYVTRKLLLENAVLEMTLSQIRNLAGGFSGDFEVKTYLPYGDLLVEDNPAVAGSTLIIGRLADATVVPQLLGSANRNLFDVTVTISNTLQANGNVVVRFPAGFTINDGGETNVTEATLVRYIDEYRTPARVIATDAATRTVTVAVGGAADDFLEAFNLVKLRLNNIRNMVARPPAGDTAETSGIFVVSTQLASGAFVENLTVPGVRISPNVIEPFPVGNGDVVPSSFVNGSLVDIVVFYSTDSVLPEDGIVAVTFPPGYLFNVSGRASITVSYDGVVDPRYTVSFSAVPTGTLVRAARVNGTASVAPRAVVAINITDARLPRAVGGSGEYNISTLTADGATIASGQIPETDIGRPSEPRNIVVDNCRSDWPEPSPRCLVVTFDPPASDGGGAVSRYQVDFDKTSNAFGDLVDSPQLAVSAGVELRVQSIELREGVTHFVRVRAANDKAGTRGFGRAGYGAALRVVSLPGPPRAAILRSDSTNRLLLSWLSPQFTGALNPAADILAFRIEFDRNGDTFEAVNANDTLLVPGAQRSLVSGLLQPGTYFARVQAANAAGFGEPALYPTTALATPIVPVTWDAVTPGEGAVLRVQVGYSTQVTIRAVDEDITDEVEVVVDAETGLPNQATLGPMLRYGVNGGFSNVAARELEMTPHEGQVGLQFQVCFIARNSNLEPLGVNLPARRCLVLHVMPPELTWTADALAPEPTPAAGSHFVTYAGCQVELPLSAGAVWYRVVFGYVASLVEFDGSETFTGAILGAQIDAPNPRDPSVPGDAVGPATNYTHTGLFRYQPPVSLAGRNQKVCLTASDEFGLASIERCVTILTGSCKACVRDGQTLSALAAEYGTDWLQLWATNPRMGNPNSRRQAGQLVNVGVLYHATGGETVEELALHFFLTTQRLLDANPDFVARAGGEALAAGRALIPGQQLCVIPPVCSVECPGGASCVTREASKNSGFVA